MDWNVVVPLCTALAAGIFAVAPLHAETAAEEERKEEARITADEGSKARAPDNTAMNERDRDTAPNRQVTADDQALGDTELISKVRRAITEDSSLSTYAQNVKVISKDGRIILRGPVRTIEEKQRVAELAAHVAGDRVTNELEVAPKKST